MGTCQVCGKSVRGTPLCEQCEKEALEKQRGRMYLLTVLMSLILIGAIYFLYTSYKEKQSQIDLSVVPSTYNAVIAISRDVIASPFIMVPAVLVLIILVFIIGTKMTK